jgi:ATP-dependent DNA helicase RecQ
MMFFIASQMKTPKTILKTVFGISSFRPPQEQVISNLLAGRNTLCLMPTGAGKSICYQVAGLLKGKTTLVLSPLQALAAQQSEILKNQGLSSLAIDGGISSKDQFKLLRECLTQPPQFLFFSVERAANDGYLEFILRRLRDSIGLVTIDEAHCVSQWGHNFRPAYKEIPDFLDRIFLQSKKPPVLCLTATLAAKDRQEICHDFNIQPADIFQSTSLHRPTLVLSRETRQDEADKLVRLEEILNQHRNEKTLVYVHRKKGKHGTKAIKEHFHSRSFNCDYFDADLDNENRRRVLAGFLDGSINTVFATGAFGMGIHIPDIRVVIHYLIPESIEQYYQEVGRAGRDGMPAHCYLLFTQTNAKVRLDLIKKGFPTAAQLQKFFDGDLLFDAKDIAALDPIQGLPDESLLCFYLLKSADIFTVACRGISQITAFESKAGTLPEFDHLRSVSKNGLLPIISQKSGISLPVLTEKLFSWYSSGAVKFSTSPGKMVFLKRRKPLTETALEKITATLEAKKDYRLENAAKLINLISSDIPLDQGVCNHLGI